MSFRGWPFGIVAVVAAGCALRAPRMHSFVLEINGPTPGDFEGSYIAATGKSAKAAKVVHFQSTDFTRRPIVFQARSRSFSYQLANNGEEPLTMKLVVDGKDVRVDMAKPGELWHGKYEPGQ